MTNAESPSASGQELPVSPREKWRGKLKLHSFLVYFYLWAIAINQLVRGVLLLERQEPSEIFRLYPKLTVLNSVTGALMIVWCLGLAVSAVRLAHFFSLLGESFPIDLLLSVVTLGIVAAYYDARKELFEASEALTKDEGENK